MNQLLIAAACGAAIGFLTIWITLILVRSRKIKTAKKIAQDIIEEAEEISQLMTEESKQLMDEFRDEQLENFEPIKHKLAKSIQKIEEDISDKKSRLNNRLKVKKDHIKVHQNRLSHYESIVDQKRGQYQRKKQQFADIRDKFVNELCDKANINREQFLEDLQKRVINEYQLRHSKLLQVKEEELSQQSEREAKRIVSTAINRFARPYCPERGIGYIPLNDEKSKLKVCGPDNIHLEHIEKEVGVDINYDEKNNSLSVIGFDPVRRELGRAVLERLSKDKTVDLDRVKHLIKKTKKELFRKIVSDGNKLAKELNLKDLHPEIKNMMGGLRYRYSFTQNQYFHCAEVGHLCGLISAELGEDPATGRRIGVLHDIGKAMDHSIDGGHAVIGADFIEKHGEAKNVVHAVRAHHFDVQPQANHDFLVIAADAISGARPGARRSTAASYTQKMQDLEVIARSFKGVTDTHILSAGREVRVMVDGQSLNDNKCLELSKEIAKKIESDMTYPGQIKVTVVRETQAVELAK